MLPSFTGEILQVPPISDLLLGARPGDIGETCAVVIVIAGLFVIEGLSVILQVASFKLTGRRIFLMAPLHHHFELRNWSETKVIVRFWIVAAIFAGLGFAIYYATF